MQSQELGSVRPWFVIPPGERGDLVREGLTHDSGCLNLRFAVQQDPNGTADAVLAARPEVQTSHPVRRQRRPLADHFGARPNADVPKRRGSSHQHNMRRQPGEDGAGFIRDERNDLRGIVEWRDASPTERNTREVNLGFYVFKADFLWPTLERIVSDSKSSGEAYVTDAVPEAVSRGTAVAVQMETPDGRLNVETPADVADAEVVMRRRIIDELLESGVHIRDRHAAWIDAGVSIEAGAIIEPGSHLRGATTIRVGSRVGPNAILEDAHLGQRCTVESCTIRGSTLRDDVEVGPYSTIRPGCEIDSHVHIGTHAELKEARIGEHVQIGHFSYVGDAVVGARTNIGAGAITCNFDGQSKQRTVIGEDAFIGSDTMLIAPVRIGDRARTGAGAVVTRDVPDDGNAVGHPARLTPTRRSRQREERGA